MPKAQHVISGMFGELRRPFDSVIALVQCGGDEAIEFIERCQKRRQRIFAAGPQNVGDATGLPTEKRRFTSN